MIHSGTERNQYVDFSRNPLAPEAHSVGVAIGFGKKTEPYRFQLGQSVHLYGSFLADLELLRICKDGIQPALLIRIVRADQPWGETAPLLASKIATGTPPPVEGAMHDPTYREGGNFSVELVKFFSLPPEPARYFVDVVVGPHFSPRLAFELY